MAAPAFLTQIIVGPQTPDRPESFGWGQILATAAIIASLLIQPSASEFQIGTHQSAIADTYSRGTIFQQPPPTAVTNVSQMRLAVFTAPQQSDPPNASAINPVDTNLIPQVVAPPLRAAIFSTPQSLVLWEWNCSYVNALDASQLPSAAQPMMSAPEIQHGTHAHAIYDSQSHGFISHQIPPSVVLTVPPSRPMIAALQQQIDLNANPSDMYEPVLPSTVANNWLPIASEFQFGTHQVAIAGYATGGSVFSIAPQPPPVVNPPPLRFAIFAAPQQIDPAAGTASLWVPAQYLNAALVWQVCGELEQPPDVPPHVWGPRPGSLGGTAPPIRPVLTAAPLQIDLGWADTYGPQPPSAPVLIPPPIAPLMTAIGQWSEWNPSFVSETLPEGIQAPQLAVLAVVPPQPPEQPRVWVTGPQPGTVVAQSPLITTAIIVLPQQIDLGSGSVRGPQPLSQPPLSIIVAAPVPFVEVAGQSSITAPSVFPQPPEVQWVITASGQSVDGAHGKLWSNAQNIPSVLPTAPPLAGVIAVQPQQIDFGLWVSLASSQPTVFPPPIIYGEVRGFIAKLRYRIFTVYFRKP